MNLQGQHDHIHECSYYWIRVIVYKIGLQRPDSTKHHQVQAHDINRKELRIVHCLKLKSFVCTRPKYQKEMSRVHTPFLRVEEITICLDLNRSLIISFFCIALSTLGPSKTKFLKPTGSQLHSYPIKPQQYKAS